MIQELKSQKQMLLKEAQRIKESIMYNSYIRKLTGKKQWQIDKDKAMAIELPLIKIHDKVKEIDKQIALLYNVKPIGIEREFFYKIPNKLI